MRSDVIQFGSFTLDTSNGELRCAEKPVKIARQPGCLLSLLASRPGKLITREEIRKHLWGKAIFVDYNLGVSYCINRVRIALHDDARAPRYIETVTGRGYRFIAPVVREAPIPAIAVLPFENLNREPMLDYFADGVTDAVITELGAISALRVVSRRSVLHLKGGDQPLTDIAGELGTDAVLEGTVLHARDSVRVTAQLIRMNPERHIWAHAYEVKMHDILRIQREIALGVAHAVQAALTPAEVRNLSRVAAVDPEAHECYLKARHYSERWTKGGFEKSTSLLHEAIAKDPDYAPPYALLANDLSLLGYWGHLAPAEAYPPAKQAVTRALALDDSLSVAHQVNAWIKWVYEWDVPGCEHELQRALELSPSNAGAHILWSHLLVAVHHDRERAFAKGHIALRLDPVSPFVNLNVAWMYLFARDLSRASDQAQKTLELHPQSIQASYVLGWVGLLRGRTAESAAMLENAVAMSPDPISIAYLGCAYARAGRTDDARRLLSDLVERGRHGHVPNKSFIVLHAALGENDRAFAWLDKACSERDPILHWLPVAPPMDPLRSDPRFEPLVRRLGLSIPDWAMAAMA